MRAAAIEEYGAPLVVRDIKDPEIGPDDVLVRVEAAGVCATDLKVIEGGIMADPSRLPLVPGHEIAGSISALGDRVAGLNVGDRVAVHALYACGQCDYCQAGEEEACPTGIPNLAGVGLDGGYAEYARVPADHLLPLPDGMSPANAAPLLCAGLTSYAALKNANLQPGQLAAVIGIGGLGHLAIPIARAMGAEVVAVTSSPEKADVARQLGARDVTDAEGAAAMLQGLGGAHVVLNTADAPEPVVKTVAGLRKQGTLALVTTNFGDYLPVPAPLLMGLQMRVVASFLGSRQDLRELLDLAVKHDIQPHIELYPLAEVNTASQRLRDNQVRYRAVLTP